ncbi:MAG: two component transcriptional regulator, winged helix family [Glaciihabitans sp.]|jgi:DNA-binding response OmpR family regulator|nr:two component transcriptional regulator, winged helix family [Glaciihabitans sp.]
MSRLLVIEDDATIGDTLRSALTANGYDVRLAVTGRSGLNVARIHAPELVLLDLGLPDLDGFSVCRDLRALLPSTVIVLLTARGDPLDIVSGLESGADDYLVKPFVVVELLARIRAHLRRAGSASGDGDGLRQTVEIGSLTVDAGARRVYVGGQEVELRAKEFDLLSRLASEPSVAIRREDLMADVWDTNWFGSTKTLDVHVAALRQRLRGAAEAAGPDATSALPEITTLRGHGYRMDLPPAKPHASR